MRVTTICIERGSLRRETDCEELVGGYSQEMMGMQLPRVLVFEVVNASIMGRVTPLKFLKFQKLLGYPNVEVHAGSLFLQWSRH